MKKLTLSLALAVVLPGMVFAQSSPDWVVSAGGNTASVPLTSEGSGIWGASPGTDISLGNGITFTLNSIEVEADPYIFYSYSVQNTGTSTILYTASIPAVPSALPAGSYQVTSSLGISLTDANPGSAVSISPASGSIQQGLIGGSDAGVDLGLSTVTNGTFGATISTTYSGGPSLYTTTGPSSNISVTESFDLSPGASVGLSGFFNVEAAPEPSSWCLGIVALLAFAVVRRLRARS